MIIGGIGGYYSRPYGSLQLTESSPQQSWTEPLTLGEVQSYLKIPTRDPADVAEDDLLRSLISAAREQAEILQGRDLVRKQWDLSIDYWPCRDIELRTPLVSVDLVSYRDSSGDVTVMVADSDYIVDSGRGIISPPYNESFPSFTGWPSSSILIRFTSGYLETSIFWNDAGARLKVGMKQLISDWFNNRLPSDAKGDQLPGYIRSLLSYGSVPSIR